MKFGDKNIEMLSAGLSKISHIKKFSLNDNRITEKSS